MKNGYLQIKHYFEDISKKHKQIKDFSGYFAREIQQKMASFSGIGSPFLTIFNYELGLDGGEMNTIGTRKITFSVLYHNPAFDNFEAQQQAIDNAEKISLQILARIKKDHNTKNHFLYNSFQKDMTKIFPVEDPNIQIYGVDVVVHFRNKEPLIVESDAWEDGITNC